MSAGNVTLEIFRTGSGRPLLLLPGMDGIEGALELIRRLSSRFEVIAVSPPGFGASDLPKHVSSVDDGSYILLDLIEKLGVEDAVVVGLSLGGWFAAEALIKNDARVSQLILAAPLGLKVADRDKPNMTDIFMLTTADAERRQQRSGKKAPDLAALNEAELRRVLRNREAVSLFGWSPYLNNPKLRHRLHRLRLPTLVLWGMQDALIPAASGSAFANLIPNAELELVENAGHRLYSDRPEELAEQIFRFAGIPTIRKERDHAGLAIQ
ncbi:alpha/beta fold hydrolase [Neorhizobium sp. DT-125]|uniref:alpha/beta fold hydrolase n=1 Tax=Neorhizobium sp. DT-125 TaxID=3396163 RepID=UPI003F19A977